MEKMKMQSKDLTREQIEKLMELFPSCVTETKLDIGGGAYRRGVYRTGVLQYAPTNTPSASIGICRNKNSQATSSKALRNAPPRLARQTRCPAHRQRVHCQNSAFLLEILNTQYLFLMLC